MAPKTRNFNELRERTRKSDPDWDASVAERQRAIEDALALADLRQSRPRLSRLSWNFGDGGPGVIVTQ